MKGTALVWGGILAILMIASFAILYVTATGEVKRGIVSSEGKLVTFKNEADLILKGFDQGLDFIAARAAYELGKVGGFYNYQEVIWNINYPKLSFLDTMLEDKIIDELPITETMGDRTINWGETEIDVSNCDPIDNCKCFNIDGSRNFSMNDRTLAAVVSENHIIDSEVASSYFKLLYVGREIFENVLYSTVLNDVNELKNRLEANFDNMDFYIAEISDDSIEIVMEDVCYPPETYCLAPLTSEDRAITKELHDIGDINWDGIIDDNDLNILKAAFGSVKGDPNWNSACDITKDGKVDGSDLSLLGANNGKKNPSYIIDANGNKIPYDYIKLKIRYNESQTGSSPLISDFSITLIPGSGSIKSGEELSALVRVNNLGGDPKIISLSSSTSPAEPTIIVQFTPPSKEATYFSLMKITTDVSTLANTYTIKVTGTDGINPPKSKDFILTLSPSMFFHLELSPNNGMVLPGDSKTTTVNIVLDLGTTSASAVALSAVAKNALSGNIEPTIGLAFSQASCTPPCSPTLTITTASTTPDNTDYNIEVTGIGGGSIDTKVYSLKVVPAFRFRLESSTSGPIVPGGSASSTISVIQNCAPIPPGTCILTKPVRLGIEGITYTKDGSNATSKFTVTFNPPDPRDPDFSATMTVTNRSAVSDGDYIISVRGDGGGWNAGTSFTLTIKTPVCYNDAQCDDGKPCTGGDRITGIDKCINAGTVNAWCNRTNFEYNYTPGNRCGTNTTNCGSCTNNCECVGGNWMCDDGSTTCNKLCDGIGGCLPYCLAPACSKKDCGSCIAFANYIDVLKRPRYSPWDAIIWTWGGTAETAYINPSDYNSVTWLGYVRADASGCCNGFGAVWNGGAIMHIRFKNIDTGETTNEVTTIYKDWYSYEGNRLLWDLGSIPSAGNFQVEFQLSGGVCNGPNYWLNSRIWDATIIAVANEIL